MSKGGGGSVGTPGQIVDVTPEEFEKLRQPIVDLLLQGAPGGFGAGAPLLSGGPQFPGPFTAGLSETEQGLLTRIGGMVQGPTPFGQVAEQTLRQTAGGQFLDPSTNPFLQATIEAAQRPTFERLQDIVLPGLRGAFTQAGQQIGPIGAGSSPFETARGIEVRGAAQALGDIATNLAGQNFQAERGRQQEAALQAPAFSKAELDRTITGLKATALPRLIEQLGVDRGLEEFRRSTDVILRALSLAIGAAGPDALALQGTAGVAGQSEGIGSILTGIGAVGSLFFDPTGITAAMLAGAGGATK